MCLCVCEMSSNLKRNDSSSMDLLATGSTTNLIDFDTPVEPVDDKLARSDQAAYEEIDPTTQLLVNFADDLQVL